ncbi:MAG: hypothetical protein EOO88_37845 [Pedobacter sp.]|nr:MAG: hypothetical protein EOO88_37845 [Pedobacter sp.]
MPNYTIPSDLITHIKDNRCAIFIGAGLSRRAKYPSWQELLNILIQAAVKRSLLVAGSQLHDQLLVHAARSEHALLTAQELSNIFGPALFREELANVFDDNRDPVLAHELIIKLPFSFALTTNYDRLIENAYVGEKRKMPTVYTYQQTQDFASALWRGNYFIFKAHGDVQTRQTMVITERDYRELIYSAPGYRAIMSSVFTTKTILFMGASLNDPEMKLLLNYLYDSFHGGGPVHYAFVSQDEFTEVETRRWLQDYNVQCILYKPTNNTHPEVDEFLQDITAAV